MVEKQVLCNCCPRRCGAIRSARSGGGVCGTGELPVVARAALHFWEEPCISGTRGSGAVFFCGCSLKCVYCQNLSISRGEIGKVLSVEKLREIFCNLAAQGAHNINLVTPTHFSKSIAAALAKRLPIPVVYNSSGYDSVQTLQQLENKIQIYLPDMKYAFAEPAARYSSAPNYPTVAKKAIWEMYRQTGPYQIDAEGILQRGVLIRHLVLPGNLKNTLGVIKWVAETFPKNSVLFSLMGQYTPCNPVPFPELRRKISKKEYETAQNYLFAAGIENGFVQSLEASDKTYIPPFDYTGL